MQCDITLYEAPISFKIKYPPFLHLPLGYFFPKPVQCRYVVLTILPKSNVLQKATLAIPRDTSKVHKLACLRLAQGKFCDVLILAWVRKLALHDLCPRSVLAVANFNEETLYTSENEKAMSCYT